MQPVSKHRNLTFLISIVIYSTGYDVVQDALEPADKVTIADEEPAIDRSECKQHRKFRAELDADA